MKYVDQLVMNCGEDSITFVLLPDKTSWIIGTEGDIRVGTAAQHARLEREHSNHFTITDLGSSASTFLNEVSLLSNVPEQFTPTMVLSIAGCDIRLQLNIPVEDEPAPAEPTEPLPVPEPSVDTAVLMHLSDESLKVMPGAATHFIVQLRNIGVIVEHYHLAVEGIPAAWVTITPPGLQLNPGDSDQMTVQIDPPRLPESTAGAYLVSVKVTAGDEKRVLGEADLQLTVEPFENYSTNLHPVHIYNGGKLHLSIENLGNTAQTYRVTAGDSDDAVVFSPKLVNPTIEPGERHIEKFKLKALKRSVIGSSKVYEIEFKVTAPNREERREDGTFVNNPWLPMWLVPILSIAAIALIALLGLLLFGGDNGEPEVADNATATEIPPTDTPGLELPALSEVSRGWTMEGANPSRSNWNSEAKFGTEVNDLNLERQRYDLSDQLSPSSIVFGDGWVYVAGKYVDDSQLLQGIIAALNSESLEQDDWTIDEADLHEDESISTGETPNMVVDAGGVITAFTGHHRFYKGDPNSPTRPIHVNWNPETGFTPSMSVIISDSILSFCDELSCGGYDLDRRTEWLQTGETPNTRPVCHAAVGNVVLGTLENRIVALDGRTGEILWKSAYEVGGRIVTNNKYVFTIGLDERDKSVLSAYDIATCIEAASEECEPVWDEIITAETNAPMAVTSDYLFVGTPQRIIAVNPEDGDIIDTARLSSAPEPDAFTHIAVSNDVMFGVVEGQVAGYTGSIIYVWSFSDGELKTLAHFPAYSSEPPPHTVLDIAIIDDRLFIIDEGGISVFRVD